ncbi:exopolysaccharide biosynthesis polyprenyl glycosylphosphotransferase [Flavobacterium agricola]|uniref:Exopolysaccharide biosynthesis polyprenyl glycosylphosphotransferase n=1 Tax=Flavobacterium agricola TaxID=2870839 RepID=A0ABY6M122_9FLAO|nr:exopolysaccharide biosynthesis polyprenyl glycosylphosphotransferase [Flavobacterium agricola]UYW00913.1 exopolysaccharide biosynthesis polyprenyl glycosylphosphotransferase [Flavobacterium agricola]
MQASKIRFSRYIRPLSYLVDLFIINWFSYFFIHQNIFFHLCISLAWVVIAVNTDFYEIYRFTKPYKIVVKIIKQYVLFIFVNLIFVGLLEENIGVKRLLTYISIAFVVVLAVKFFIHYFLKFFRIYYGGNYRNVVIIGDRTDKLADFFTRNPDFGYVITKRYTKEAAKQNNYVDLFSYLKNGAVNEIYISIASFTDKDIYRISKFADNNLIKVKLLIDRKSVFTRNLVKDFYNDIPIVSLRVFPLDDVNNRIIKRVFDVVFSTLVIIFLLSWLIPILALLIKLESRGPVFFTQKRNGLNYKEFCCIKFRSMYVNKVSDTNQVSRGDRRITRIGAVLRKTSLDELPQFFNVFIGDMSVVGPRPHMVNQTKEFALSIDKFMIRHFIKPGITGFAQISGCRGEVETKRDILKRVRYDIYYSENWSILFDVKIIIKTVLNAVKGEEKAY